MTIEFVIFTDRGMKVSTRMKERKMAMVASKVKLEEEDSLDVKFWLNQPVADRIAEVTRLRHEYYSWLLGEFPQQMEKTVMRKKL